MRDHELELIAALVEGRLEDESEARALVASSPELYEEYEAQRLAYEALRSAPTVAMSETERATLHRDVWTALRSDGPVAASRRTPWYHRWTPVAAGLFVLVGLVAVINQAGGGDSGESARLAADMPVETTAADAAIEGDDGAQAPAGADSGGGEESTVTTAAASSDTTEAMAVTPEPQSGDETAFYVAEAESLREGDVENAALQSYDEDASRAELETCLDEAGLPGYEVLETLAGSLDADTDGEVEAEVSRLIAAIPEEADLSTAPIAFVDLVECVLIHLDE